MKKPLEKMHRLSHKQTICSKKCSLLTCVYSAITLIILALLLQIQSFQFQTPFSPSKWGLQQNPNPNCSKTNDLNLQTMSNRLRNSITFLPLKDLRFAKTAMEGHTWFMSSLHDTVEEDESEYLYFPSDASSGRILCLKGNHTGDGSMNGYALAWPEYLPENSTLLPGLTYVSDNYYDYENLWHSLSAMIPFVRWYERQNCEVPARWVLFHWGEVRIRIGNWIGKLIEATFGVRVQIEGLRDWVVCFEKSVVFRRNFGKMGSKNRLGVFDMLRCKARLFCNVSLDQNQEFTESGAPVFGFTVLLRTGARSFKNESVVIGIFEQECGKVDGCKFKAARSDELSFCDQVKLMSSTSILASSHGAQMANLFFMDRDSSVMEFFPRGWLELAGPGQYVFHWMASWSGMRHQGSWRDHQGEECPQHLKKENPPRCFNFYKDSQLGHNQTYFANWTMSVVNEMKKKKIDESTRKPPTPSHVTCPC